jgi:hypothetical protein
MVHTLHNLRSLNLNPDFEFEPTLSVSQIRDQYNHMD